MTGETVGTLAVLDTSVAARPDGFGHKVPGHCKNEQANRAGDYGHGRGRLHSGPGITCKKTRKDQCAITR